jgi:hypothetical protein
MEEGICILPYNKSIRAWQPNKANLQCVESDGASDGGIQATNHPLKWMVGYKQPITPSNFAYDGS